MSYAQAGTANRAEPELLANAASAVAEQRQVNDRLSVILGQLRTPGPQPVADDRGINAGAPIAITLQSHQHTLAKLQSATHSLLAEIESLV
jgi:hypothetical protein